MAMRERRRKVCRFDLEKIENIDYKDVERLRQVFGGVREPLGD